MMEDMFDCQVYGLLRQAPTDYFRLPPAHHEGYTHQEDFTNRWYGKTNIIGRYSVSKKSVMLLEQWIVRNFM
jgi:hypothetical protein